MYNGDQYLTVLKSIKLPDLPVELSCRRLIYFR